MKQKYENYFKKKINFKPINIFTTSMLKRIHIFTIRKSAKNKT